MKRALIFGVTGQAGSYLAELLLSKGYVVYGVARRTSVPNAVRINHLLSNKNFILLSGDITDVGSIYSVLKEATPDEVYNAAAQSHVKVSFSEPVHTFSVVSIGVLNILNSLRNLYENKVKFLHFSSSEQFANSTSGKQNENTTMHPVSPYGISKLAAYHIVRMYREAYGMFACNAIFFNMESERRGENFVTRKITKYIGELYRASANKGLDPLTVINQGFPKLKLGNLEAMRDWGYSKEYVFVAYLMLQQSKAEDFVIATGETHSVEEFLKEAVAYAFKNSVNYKGIIEIDPQLYRAAEVVYLCGDASKAKAQLGWEPTVKFKELVHKMVDYDVGA